MFIGARTVSTGLAILAAVQLGLTGPSAAAGKAGMALVPGGKFLMGSDELMDSDPAHEVHLDSFYIDITEVTVAAYRAFAKGSGKAMPKAPQWGWKDDHPIISVSWSDARDYCQKSGKRLPTEAEWEKAARGTDSRIFPWEEGKKADGRANQLGDEDGFATTAPVGTYPSGRSPYGVMDMAGNVWEWCADWYDRKYYRKSPAKNPQGPEKGTTRAYRGGAWNNSPYVLQSAGRGEAVPDKRDTSIGFRCASGT